MCANPGCNTPEFNLKGPLARGPMTGWPITTLPEGMTHLQAGWDQYRATLPAAQSGQAARAELLSWLRAQGVTGVEQSINMQSARQWCEPEPNRCPPGWDGAVAAPVASTAPNLPWAPMAWKLANMQLHDGVTDEAAGAVLARIVDTLTALIESPEGCQKCADHWAQVRGELLPPESPTLHEARVWLFTAHNRSKEHTGKPLPTFQTISKEFAWTTR